jgi:dienelactone hydrolase
MRTLILSLGLGWLALQHLPAADAPSPVTQMWARHFEAETKRISAHTFAGIETRSDWEQRAPEYRRQLREMLGLDPWPERTPLNAVVTGTTEHADFTVEKVHFQSSPGLYVTGNLYVPKERDRPLPAVLYVCGHGPSKKAGVSFGNKVSYQHHGAWFARHGYVCLIIDTIQMGEIEGLHHGTYREGMWWWNSRGYTPAGVEAWNSIRALDYLQSRPEVDPEKLGMTGRSGGGAYSWWTAAIDERVKVVAPIAGITDLHDHVVEGVVSGHCDCMFMVNTYRWDYAEVAALVAPRPLLIGNTDRDAIFPLAGVVRVHRQVAGIYKLLNAETNLALLITEGPHKDTQDLQVPVLRWFNRFLKGGDPLIRIAAEKFFEPEQLKVFPTLPADEIVTRVHETFVPAAPAPQVPADRAEWERMKAGWREALREQAFAGWPRETETAGVTETSSQRFGSLRVSVFELETQPGLTLPLVILEPRGRSRSGPELRVLGHVDWQAAATTLAERFSVHGLASPTTQINEPAKPGAHAIIPKALDHPLILFAPRGAGRTAPDVDARNFIQFRRRFMMLGQTLDGMRVWDIRQAVQASHREFNLDRRPLTVSASGPMTINTMFAALHEPRVAALRLDAVPGSLLDGPDFVNVLKVMELPELLAAVSVDRPEAIDPDTLPAAATDYARAVQRSLGGATRR